MQGEIVNKVASSGLITIDLEEYYKDIEIASFDIAQNLWQGLVIKEKDFREFVKTNDWSVYTGKYVNIYCSADAIVPSWAYLLLTIALQPYAKLVVLGSEVDLQKAILDNVIDEMSVSEFTDGRIIIKGCANIPQANYALVKLTQKLIPVAKSLMFGEPCSTVPLYKKPKGE